MDYITQYYCSDFTKLQDFVLNDRDFMIFLKFPDRTIKIPFHPNSENIILDDIARHGELKKRIKT